MVLLAGALLAGCGGSGGGGDAATADVDEPVCGCSEAQACGVDPCGVLCGEGCGADGVCVASECAPAATCDALGFTALTRTATLDHRADGARLEVRVDSRAQIPFERLVLRSFERFGGPMEPGVYRIDDTGYAECGLCLTAHDGCSPAGCARDFLADAGTVVIERLDAGDLALAVRDVRLRQVYINDRTLASMPVPEGEQWCVEDFEVTAPLVVHNETDFCVAAGSGRRLGDKIADFTLPNCLGDPVSLHAACGTARAVWLVLATGWCSACAEHLPDVAEIAEAQRDLGLRALVILGENEAGTEPSQAFCAEYAAAMGLDPASVLIDWSGDRGFATVEDHVELYSGDGLSLPWDGVLDASVMR